MAHPLSPTSVLPALVSLHSCNAARVGEALHALQDVYFPHAILSTTTMTGAVPVLKQSLSAAVPTFFFRRKRIACQVHHDGVPDSGYASAEEDDQDDEEDEDKGDEERKEELDRLRSDAFERGYAIKWLTGMVKRGDAWVDAASSSATADAPTRSSEEHAAREARLEDASRLLSRFAGDDAIGQALTRTFVFPFHAPLESPFSCHHCRCPSPSLDDTPSTVPTAAPPPPIVLELNDAPVDETDHTAVGHAPVCLVKGPKKCGKSTLARTLVNRLLSRYRRVAFLECDLGQSEFTPGGMVALNIVENFVFGPPFTHPSLPYRAHYIGSTSPRASPSHYLHSIHSLLESYKLDLQFPVSIDELIHDAIPLVVNTMGWNKGLGTNLNARIEELVEASHTFNIDDAKEHGWPTPPQSQHVPRFPTTLPLVHSGRRRPVDVETIHTEMTNTYYTATDHRHRNILSYFHAVFPEQSTSSSGSALNQITATIWDASLPMCARSPYEVHCTQAFDQVYLTGPGYEDVVPSELTRVLNGAIVGLVSDSLVNSFSRGMQLVEQESSSLSYTPGEPPPDPALSTCHGLALIRGISLTLNPLSPHMHIFTPLPTALLAQTRLLVKGEQELPIWGMLDFRENEEGRVAGVEKGQVPYLQWGKAEAIGSEKRRVRRNLMRRGQM